MAPPPRGDATRSKEDDGQVSVEQIFNSDAPEGAASTSYEDVGIPKDTEPDQTVMDVATNGEGSASVGDEVMATSSPLPGDVTRSNEDHWPAVLSYNETTDAASGNQEDVGILDDAKPDQAVTDVATNGEGLASEGNDVMATSSPPTGDVTRSKEDDRAAVLNSNEATSAASGDQEDIGILSDAEPDQAVTDSSTNAWGLASEENDAMATSAPPPGDVTRNKEDNGPRVLSSNEATGAASGNQEDIGILNDTEPDQAVTDVATNGEGIASEEVDTMATSFSSPADVTSIKEHDGGAVLSYNEATGASGNQADVRVLNDAEFDQAVITEQHGRLLSVEHALRSITTTDAALTSQGDVGVVMDSGREGEAQNVVTDEGFATEGTAESVGKIELLALLAAQYRSKEAEDQVQRTAIVTSKGHQLADTDADGEAIGEPARPNVDLVASGSNKDELGLQASHMDHLLKAVLRELDQTYDAPRQSGSSRHRADV